MSDTATELEWDKLADTQQRRIEQRFLERLDGDFLSDLEDDRISDEDFRKDLRLAFQQFKEDAMGEIERGRSRV